MLSTSLTVVALYSLLFQFGSHTGAPIESTGFVGCKASSLV